MRGLTLCATELPYTDPGFRELALNTHLLECAAVESLTVCELFFFADNRMA